MKTKDTVEYIPFPQLNKPAPPFNARTTHGTISLKDFLGRWLVLFSHPADFTPVCTSEFISFAKSYPLFQALNCELLGLSIDSPQSHIAWMLNIQEKFNIAIPFPIISDISMAIAKSYGMIQTAASDTSTVRCVFVIDDKGILRSMLYYPMTNGRSVNEVLRLVTAIQTSDARGVSTPEGWTPESKVLLPTPKSFDTAMKYKKNTKYCTDWYYCEAEL